MKAVNDRIIVGVDFSPCSQIAAQTAIDLAKQATYPVLLIHAVTARELSSEYGGDLAKAHSRMIGFVRQLDRQGVPLFTRTELGQPEEVLRCAVEEGFGQLLMVGSHGSSEYWRFRMGHVAEHLFQDPSGRLLAVHAPIEAKRRDTAVPIPWFPRDTASTMRFVVPLGQGERMATACVPCPLTGVVERVEHCLACSNFVSGCVSTATNTLELVCLERKP